MLSLKVFVLVVLKIVVVVCIICFLNNKCGGGNEVVF